MTLVQTFSCDSCGYTWGPVGVAPMNPSGPRQCFFLCLTCRVPVLQMIDAGEAARPCARCQGHTLVPLRCCPACDAESVAWT